ncbi:MAG: DUF2163 domain-containing protein [Pseudomonadota bacterium]
MPSAAYIAKEEARTRRPAELYRFINGPLADPVSEHYYTSADEAITYNGHVYNPAALTRSAVQFDGEMKVSGLTVSIVESAEPINRFLSQWPLGQVWVEVLKVFRDYLDEALVVFLGQASKASLSGRRCDIECVGFEFFLSQKLPIRRFQLKCNYQLFDSHCDPDGSLAASFPGVAATVTVSSDRLTISAAAFDALADGYFTWGYVAAGGDRRPIVGHVGPDLALRYPFPGLETGDTATAYPGCDKKLSTCRDKFNNKARFGGFPWIPSTSPFILGVSEAGGTRTVGQ